MGVKAVVTIPSTLRHILSARGLAEVVLKILMISDVYFPRINGVSTSIATFRRELEAMGHEVTLIAPAYPVTGVDEPRVIRVPSRYLWLDPEDRMMRRGPLMDIARRLSREAFDLLHIQTPFVAHYAGARLADLLGIPRVESYHTFFEEYLFHYLPFLPRPMTRAAARVFSRRQCNNVDGVIVPSAAMMEVLRAYGVDTREEIIPTGIELGDFHTGDGTAFRRRLGIAEDQPALIHVGRIAFEKNVDFLVRVLHRVRRAMPEAILIIAGEGPALRHVRHLTHKLGLEANVRFVGYLDRRHELLDCYQAGDAFVFASRTETQGLVLLEAMALGVPVLSTAVMGTRDIMASERGGIIAEEDETDFADKALRILSDRELRRRLGREGRAYVREWSADAMASKLVGFYERVIAGHGLSGAATAHSPVKRG